RGWALQAEVVDVGQECARGVGWQPGEPKDHIAAAGRPGQVQPHHAADTGRARDSWQVCQRGPGTDAQLEAGTGGIAEVDPRAADGDPLAHRQQQASARVQVSEAGRGVPVGMPARRVPYAEDQVGKLGVVAAVRAERRRPDGGQRLRRLGGRRGRGTGMARAGLGLGRGAGAAADGLACAAGPGGGCPAFSGVAACSLAADGAAGDEPATRRSATKPATTTASARATNTAQPTVRRRRLGARPDSTRRPVAPRPALRPAGALAMPPGMPPAGAPGMPPPGAPVAPPAGGPVMSPGGAPALRLAGAPALRPACAPAAVTRAQAAGRSGRRRCAAWPEVASNSSRLTVASAPGARCTVSYSWINGSGSVPTALAMARMWPRA